MDCVEINLKKYEYSVPESVKELKKDRITFTDILNIIDGLESKIEELEKAKAVEEPDDSEYIDDWLETRSR